MRKVGDSTRKLVDLIDQYEPDIAAIGNGTGSREFEIFFSGLINSKDIKSKRVGRLQYQIVSENGASVYSSSEQAAQEHPNVDVTFLGAVSIARRLLDPLSELVKIPPESAGVGMYQHDLDQKKLAEAASDVVKDCVNQVGVNLNTASVCLLKQVSGLSEKKAENIVRFREKKWKFCFSSRFEQC
eukprot:TRINITY_DN5686_c0_g1_i3.p1 TRINITY_DN5686_c0_g1~~TRINITY_DN5686_c0_g1_i3.p1  ORF type:complete len:185 (+),score=42.19 TRINITY_DN5686_c0_g1_i3:489-1043(+)